MKSSLLIAALIALFGTQAFASAPTEPLLKSCHSTVRFEGKTLETNMEVFGTVDKASARITVVRPAPGVSEDVAQVVVANVRPGLAKLGIEGGAIDSLNLAEKLVVHAMSLEKLGGMGFKSGIDLNAVRSATVYSIGTSTSMGMSAIVEAKNAQGKVLGSYLGGFFVAPCK